MSSILTPAAADASGLAFTGVTVQDPDGVQTLPRVAGAATFGKPVQDEILALITSNIVAPGYMTSSVLACLAGLAVGDPVYMSASGTVSLALATTPTTAQVIGFVRYKPTTTTCYLNHFRTGGFGTPFGTPIYLTDAGSFSATAGTIPTIVGICVNTAGGAYLFANPLTPFLRSAQLSADAILASEIFT